MELRERNTDTLKEKLRAKYHGKEFAPAKVAEERSDAFSMGFFFFMLISLLYETQVVLIPQLYPTSWTMSIVMFIVFCEVAINWHRTYFDVDNWVKKETKEKYFPESDETPPNWRTCYKCQLDVPPRSHHCKLCGKCILKRDIHCFITGSCIGYHNQKFFYSFCLWSAVGNAVCVYLQLNYLHLDIPMDTGDLITYIPPVFFHRWIMKYITFGQLMIICHVYCCLFCFLASTMFFLWQTLLISQGLTAHEAWKGIFRYRGKSFRENVVSVFGSFLNIPVLIFVPIRFQQDGDGVNWRLRSKGQ